MTTVEVPRGGRRVSARAAAGGLGLALLAVLALGAAAAEVARGNAGTWRATGANAREGWYKTDGGSCFVSPSFLCEAARERAIASFDFYPSGAREPLLFDPRAFLEAFGGQTVHVVGDSINRGLFQTLACRMVAFCAEAGCHAEAREKVLRVGGVTVRYQKSKLFSRFEKGVADLGSWDWWMNATDKADVLVLGNSNWLTNRTRWCDSRGTTACGDRKDMPLVEGVSQAFEKILERLVAELERKAAARPPDRPLHVIWRSQSPRHYGGGALDFNTGGRCAGNAGPAAEAPSDRDAALMAVEDRTVVRWAAESAQARRAAAVAFMDVTTPSATRRDAHPATDHLPANRTGDRAVEDCNHWCMHGPVDTWLALLVRSRRDLHARWLPLAPRPARPGGSVAGVARAASASCARAVFGGAAARHALDSCAAGAARTGGWPGGAWASAAGGGPLRPESADDHSLALAALRRRRVVFVGESTARLAFRSAVALAAGAREADAREHGSLYRREGGVEFDFVWAPRAANVTAFANAPDGMRRLWAGPRRAPSLVVVAVGLHDLLYDEAESSEVALRMMCFSLSRAAAETDAAVLVLTPPQVRDEALSGHRRDAAHFRNASVARLAETMAGACAGAHGVSVGDLFDLSGRAACARGGGDDDDDGIHSLEASDCAATGVVAVVAWRGAVGAETGSEARALAHAVTGVVACAVLAAFCVAAVRRGGAPPLLGACAGIAAVALAIVALDGPNERHRVGGVWYAAKRTDLQSFWLWSAAALAVSAFTVRRSGSGGGGETPPVSRAQTEEWKGWMQCSFVLYHYFEVKPAYNAMRVFVGAYVWMTGFGNYRSLQKRPDYSAARAARVLFRLNFLAAVASVAADVPFMVYYICPLISFSYLCVHGTMAALPSWNVTARGQFAKLAALLAALAALHESDTAFDLVFGWVPGVRVHGSTHEWRFRAGLDRYMAWLGMACAAAYPAAARGLNWLDAERARRPAAGRCATATVAAAAAAAVLSLAPMMAMPKREYNAWHPYTAGAPLLGYLVLRNLAPAARGAHLGAFQWIGARTLETYILQSSLLMTAEAKQRLLVWPRLGDTANFAVALAFYLTACDLAFRATGVITAAVVPAKGGGLGAAARLAGGLFVAATLAAAAYVYVEGV